MRSFWWVLLVVSTLTMLFACTLAEARPASTREEARAAERAFEIGEYAQALERLEALFLATNDAALLVPMATCYRALNRPSDATRALRLHALYTR